MTHGDHTTHAELAKDLQATIERLREDIESRTDPLLEEIANALDLILRLTTHAHDHATENAQRLDRFEAS